MARSGIELIDRLRARHGPPGTHQYVIIQERIRRPAREQRCWETAPEDLEVFIEGGDGGGFQVL